MFRACFMARVRRRWWVVQTPVAAAARSCRARPQTLAATAHRGRGSHRSSRCKTCRPSCGGRTFPGRQVHRTKAARRVHQTKAARRNGEQGQNSDSGSNSDLNPSQMRLEVLQMRPRRASFHGSLQTCCFLIVFFGPGGRNAEPRDIGSGRSRSPSEKGPAEAVHDNLAVRRRPAPARLPQLASPRLRGSLRLPALALPEPHARRSPSAARRAGPSPWPGASLPRRCAR